MKLILTILISLGLSSAAEALTTAPAGETWIREMLSEDPACDPGAIDALSRAARRGIEREVGRREHAVKPPSAAAELSCLGDLMSANLDVAFPTATLTAGLPGFLQGILEQMTSKSGLSVGGIDAAGLAAALAAGQTDPTRVLSSSLCRFAEARWSQATLPALGGFDDLAPLALLPLLLPNERGTANFPPPNSERRPEAASGNGQSGQAARILGLGGNQ